METLNPLETRSLPGTLWEKVPSLISQTDIQLSQSLEDSFDKNSWFWQKIHFFTEEPWAIGLQVFIFLIFGICLRAFYKQKPSERNHLREVLKNTFSPDFIFFIFFLIVVLAASDALSSFFKIQVGRLKPHVDFYNPSARPALSFPSNHAVNCAALVGLFFFTYRKLNILSQRRLSLFFGFGFLFLVGLSRVVLGEHHILDILGGWLFGFFWAYACTLLFFYLVVRLRRLV
jgi:membrane-associated phospholipid phosphatase